MEIIELDFKMLLNNVPKTQLDEGHLTTMLYNLLCALNFLHSAGIVHNNLHPGNVLVDSECSVMIADMGISRVMPELTQT